MRWACLLWHEPFPPLEKLPVNRPLRVYILLVGAHGFMVAYTKAKLVCDCLLLSMVVYEGPH